MALIPAKCTQCGANITIDDTKETGKCQYCGMSFVVEKTVNNYTINNINIMPQNKTQQSQQTTSAPQKTTIDSNISTKDVAFFNNLDNGIEYYKHVPMQTRDDFNSGTYRGQPQQLPQYIGNKAVHRNDIDRIEQCIRHGDKTSAVKIVRELTGLSLTEIDTFIEYFSVINKNEPHSLRLYQKQNFGATTERNRQLSPTHNNQVNNKNTSSKKTGCLIVLFGFVAMFVVIPIIVMIILFFSAFFSGLSEGYSENIDCTHNWGREITTTHSYQICSLCSDIVSGEEEVDNIYLDKLMLDNKDHYAFAVEIDDYNGDVFEAGTYRFYPEDVVLGTKKMPIVWDIYVSDKIYDDISQLHDDNPDFVDGVGGIDKREITVTLEKGQYVYIKYYKPANDNPTGHLEMVKVEE